MGYISLDFGTDGVIQKFAEDDIWLAEFRVNVQALKELKVQDASAEAKKTVAAIMNAYESVLGTARTIVFDKATQLWELMRMAEFGKLDHVKGHHYVEVNAQYRNVIQLAYDQDKTNLILIHGLKDEYVQNENWKAGTSRDEGDGGVEVISDSGVIPENECQAVDVFDENLGETVAFSCEFSTD